LFGCGGYNSRFGQPTPQNLFDSFEFNSSFGDDDVPYSPPEDFPFQTPRPLATREENCIAFERDYLEPKRRKSRQHHNNTRVRNGVRRQTLTNISSFGQYGEGVNAFREPNGLTILSDGRIAVVDTNTHSVKVFSSLHQFEYSIGKPGGGKTDGCLLFPYRIAVIPDGSDDLVVVQRHPRPQIQIFAANGTFKHRFGQHLQKPRALFIDELNQILVVESQLMLLHVFTQWGDSVGRHDLGQHLKFPTGVCAIAARNEIYISDNHLHCIQIFTYTGDYLRELRDGNFILYPTNLLLNSRQQLIVMDNHHGMNLTVYDLGPREHRRLAAFTSRTCHSQILDAAVDGETNKIHVASKDYRIYTYQLPLL